MDQGERQATDRTWTLRMPAELMAELENHLFPGDRDEHGAVIGASVVRTDRGVRLLARRLFLAEDGVDYVPGRRGYRMLTASFVRTCALACADEGLAYLAVHCHGGTTRVGFSGDDLASHERGYPALLDILDGPPVGGLVFAEDAVAGDIWLSHDERVELEHLVVVGRPIRRLFDAPPARPPAADERYDRQARIFGDRGQALLAGQKIGVVGAGGAGSLIVEYLSRLGVGHLVVIDPQRIEPTNLSRIVGSLLRDVRPWLTNSRMPKWLQRWGSARRTPKVVIAERVARQANPNVTFTGILGDVADPAVCENLIDCDYLFLAADTAQARLIFNAIVHQYLIPATQVGAKVQVDKETGELLDIFSVVRPMTPGLHCLWCNGLISPAKLQEEATNAAQLAAQRYVEEDGVHAASVITLNAVAAAIATNDYLMNVTGLADITLPTWLKHVATTLETQEQLPRRDIQCRECSAAGRLAAGTAHRLPTRSN